MESNELMGLEIKSSTPSSGVKRGIMQMGYKVCTSIN